MPILNVYDKTGDLIEFHQFDGSLAGWLKENVESYRETTRPPYSALLNGHLWPYVNHDADLGRDDVIDLTVEPCDPYTIVYWVIAIASAAYSYYVASNIETNYQSSAEQGKSIYSANARANSINPSGVVREVAGNIQIYPDLINPATRKYENHEEYLFLMLGVCSEYIALREDNFYIADTPLINYEGDYELQVFEPGDSVVGHEAYENWYQTKEVSDLRLTTKSNPKFGIWTASYSGSTITSYLDGNLEEFPFSVGERFEITSGSNIGYYEVVSIGSPNTSATVVELERPTGSTTRVETIAQNIRTTSTIIGIASRGRFNASVVSRSVLRNSFDSLGAPTLTTPSPLIEVVTWESIAGGINWEGPYNVIPENETTRYSEVDIIFPQGLTALDSDNETINATVDIEIQWREVGSSTWTTVSGTSYTAATYDQRAYTITIDYGSQIRPEIRLRRVTQESDEIGTADMVEIKRIKSLLSSPSSYPGVTTAALKIKGTNALARTSENRINIRGATRKLPTISELEAGSFDLTSSATDIVTNYYIVSPSLLASRVYTNIGDFPDFGANPANEHSIDISSDGLTLLSNQNNAGKIYTLDSAYSIGGDKTYRGYLVLAGPRPVAARFSTTSYVYDVVKEPDPSSNYIVGLSDLTIPGSGEISYSDNSSFQPNIPSIVGLAVNGAGTKFWLGRTNGVIYEYSMSSANDLTTTVTPSPLVTFDASAQLSIFSPSSNLRSIYLANSEQYLYVLDDNGVVYAYTLGTPGDITTAVYDGDYFQSGLSNVKDLVVTSTKMYISTYGAEGFIHEYNLNVYSNSRSTRSIARFVGWTIYDALGSDASSMIDWSALSTLDTLWESRGDYLDIEFSDETTLWEALKMMLAPGYAEPTIKEGKLLPVRIASGSDYSHLYTPDIMLEGGLQVDSVHYDPQEPDGIDVEYFSLVTFENEVVECRASGDTGLRPKRIQAPGITDETKAWRFGMRERNRIRQKPATFTFRTEMDALNSEYGDPVAIASELFVSQCGEITGYSEPTITLDFVPEFGSGTHYIAARNREGEFSGLYVVAQGSPNNTLIISSSPLLDFTPVVDGSMDSSFVAFGDATSWGKRAIIRRITPQSDGTVTVTAEEYVAAVYADDDNSPPG